MADAALRELERAWRASGALADEVRLLAARARAGDLPAGRLELAAWLGQPAARAALGAEAPAGEHVPWERWGEAVDADGLALLLRLARADALERVAAPPWRPAFEAAWADLAAAAAASDGPGASAVAARADAQRAVHRQADDTQAWLAWSGLAGAASTVEGVVAGQRGAGPLLVTVLSRDGAPRAEVVAWALGPEHGRGGVGPAGAPDGVVERDEVEYLRARRGRGELDDRRLRVAAHGGHPAAAALLGGPPPAAPATTAEAVEAWLRGLRALDPDLARRVAARWAWQVGLQLTEGAEGLAPLAEGLLGLSVVDAEEVGPLARDTAAGLRAAALAPPASALARWLAPLGRRLAERAPDAARALAPDALRRRWLRAAAAACEAAPDPAGGPGLAAALWALTPPLLRGSTARELRAHAVHEALRPPRPAEGGP